MKYRVVVEKGVEGFGAYVPDLPGCIAVGKTREEVLRLIEEAVTLHGAPEDVRRGKCNRGDSNEINRARHASRPIAKCRHG